MKRAQIAFALIGTLFLLAGCASAEDMKNYVERCAVYCAPHDYLVPANNASHQAMCSCIYKDRPLPPPKKTECE